MKFHSTATGPLTVTVVINDNTAATPHAVTLIGTGKEGQGANSTGMATNFGLLGIAFLGDRPGVELNPEISLGG